jgi:apolipoprotein N-acyltransferase
MRAFFLFVPPGRLLLMLAFALTMALAFPPYDYGFLGWVALVPLYLAVRDLRPGAAFVAGLLGGTLLFGVVLAYIGRFGILPWLALAIFQGLSVAVSAYLAAMMWRCPNPWLRVPALAACWTVGELLRGHCGGLAFTFGHLGYSQHQAAWVLQLASLVGHYGLGLALALLSAAVVEAAPPLRRPGARATGGPLVVTTALLLVAVTWGAIRVHLLHRRPGYAGLRVAAVQGAVRNGTPDVVLHSADVYERLTDSRARGADLVVWPETAVPGRLNDYPAVYQRVRQLAARHRARLIVGAAERGPGDRTYNTLWAFDRAGDLRALYRKQRLVLFGEYLPWRSHLRRLVAAYPIRRFDYSPGVQDVLIRAEEAEVAPMICFESIFPDVARRLTRHGAQVLLVSTSDAWVGEAPAELYQHSQCSVLRAVETGRWLVRAGGTGVTCIVDPTGRVVSSAPPFVEAVVRGTVWPRRALTPYSVWGDLPLAWVVGLLLIAGLTDIYAEDRARRSAP